VFDLHVDVEAAVDAAVNDAPPRWMSA
jgi:hypothetical protein